MLLFYCSHESVDRTECFYAEMPRRRAQDDVEKGETSDLAASNSNYQKLPYYLKSCLDYCWIVRTLLPVLKKELVRFLLAEGLVPEKPGEVMEDVAANILKELAALGMIEETSNGYITASEMYKKSSILKVEEQDFVNEAKNSPTHAVITYWKNPKQFSANTFKNLSMRSLFMSVSGRDLHYDSVFWETICASKFMVVLNLRGGVDYLPDEVGDLVNLRYLGLFDNEIKELPITIGNLEKLQTLDISDTKICQLPVEILNLKRLRHLLMHGHRFRGFVRIPEGMGSLVNLQTWDGVRCGPDVAVELGKLTQLRELGVEGLSEDCADEISAAIMKMENLVSLSLTAQASTFLSARETDILPELESFSPPSHLQEVCLEGGLIEIPQWIFSMENLTSLELWNSRLLDDSFTAFQHLPQLKHLILGNAYNRKCIGKEFCNAGGFPMLETLTIWSKDLVEWSEIIDGAFPRLRCLQFYNCLKLRFLPEGLQYITTIEELNFSHLHGDLGRRLNGQENYKIKHISNFRSCEFPEEVKLVIQGKDRRRI